MPRQAELHELVGAYALNALEHDELEEFERHLEACPRCRAELREHRETAALLAHAGEPAPSGVWERIASQLEEAPEGVGDIVPIFRSRRRADWWRRGGVIAAGAAAALIAVNSLVLLQRDDSRPISSVQAMAARAADEPGARFATLRQPDGTAVADIVINAKGTGYLIRGSLPALDKAHTYQLWALSGQGSPVSLGLLGSHPISRSFAVQLPIENLAVTVEAVGGATQPTSPPFVSGDVNA
jgi:anti-sigma-K factor RskA